MNETRRRTAEVNPSIEQILDLQLEQYLGSIRALALTLHISPSELLEERIRSVVAKPQNGFEHDFKPLINKLDNPERRIKVLEYKSPEGVILTYNPNTHIGTSSLKPGEAIRFTPTESGMMELLMINNTTVVFHKQLMNASQPYDVYDDADARVLTKAHILHIRDKIGDEKGEIIWTHTSIGYSLQQPLICVIRRATHKKEKVLIAT